MSPRPLRCPPPWPAAGVRITGVQRLSAKWRRMGRRVWRSGGNGDGRRRTGTELGKLAWAHVCIIILDELCGLDLSAKFMISDPGCITL